MKNKIFVCNGAWNLHFTACRRAVQVWYTGTDLLYSDGFRLTLIKSYKSEK